MLEHAYAVVMAGGRGERFWPLSTARRPKQLLSIVGGKPMVALMLDYIGGLIPPERVFVITGEPLADAVRKALPQVPPGNVIGEPCGRDTAPAVALGMTLVKARDPQAAFCVLTSDHLIGELPRFRATLRAGLERAVVDDILITIGITPAEPNTGFGYIEAGDALPGGGEVGFFAARRFVEKPDAATAAKYVAAGNYFWNSGMFIWSVAALDDAFRLHYPVLHEMSRRLIGTAGRPAFAAALRTEYEAIKRISVDYAIMEKARNIVMARGTFVWDDIGSWPALANHIPADSQGNTVLGACEALDARGNIVVSEGRLTALLGVENLVVVQAEGATLVCARDRAQDVKKLVQQIAARKTYEHLL
jgi:mannose-1-phosphate guanylyltransferase